MRIALIAPPWAPVPPALYGGIESAVDSLARGLAEAGHEVLLFTTGDSTSPVPRSWVLAEAEGIRIGMAVPELRHIMAAYDEVQGFDIVHDHTIMGPVYAERYPELPVVTTIHGPFNDELRDVYRRIADRVPIIAISNAQCLPAPEIPIGRVIHHGVDANAFPVGTGGDYCLFLGRMAPEKGPHRAAKAAKEAGVPLIMMGKLRESWEKQFFDKEVKPLLGGDIKYVGEADHDEKIRLLAGAKATLFPIRWNEPFGLVMIESLACGTPVLAFPEGAAPEVIEDKVTGFLCKDDADLAAAIDKVDTLDRTKCRAAVEGYFSMDRMVADHVAFFEEIVNR